VIGPLVHPRRYPPSREPRPPRWERWVKVPFGLVVERLCSPFVRWVPAELRVPEISVRVRGLGAAFAGYRIALVTDLHHGRTVPTWWLDEVAARTTALAPDLVALGGDFVSHSRRELTGLFGPLRRFAGAGRDGAVAVLGNHDHWVDAEAVTTTLAACGIEVLTNRHRLVRRDGAALAIAGVDDFAHGAVRLDDALAGVAAALPRVVLSHNPDLIEYVPRGVRVDVMLSGHTHNGQMHWPLIGPLTVPSQFGGRYLHGLKQVGDTLLYVSAGVGTSAIPFRWGNPPELPVIRLEGGEDGLAMSRSG